MKTVWQFINNPLFLFILGAGGLGAFLLNLFYDAGALVETLLGSQTTLGISIVLIILAAILGYLRGKPKKKRAVKIVEELFMGGESYKWKITLYSNGSFQMEPIPYCSKHEMVLFENYPLYLCPLHNECNCQISRSDLPAIRDRSRSIIEAHIRENKPHLK